MKHAVKLSLTLALSACLHHGQSWAASKDEETAKAIFERGIQHATLSKAGATLLQSSDGRLYVSSANGRYVAEVSHLVDRWSSITVRSLSDLEASRKVLDFTRIGMKFDELSTITIGPGTTAEEYLLIVDPSHPPARQMMLRAVEYAKGRIKGKLHILFTPASPDKGPEVLQMACHVETFKESGLQRVAKGALKEADPNCQPNKKSYQANILATMFEVNALPYFIGGGGRVYEGTQIKSIGEMINGQ